MMRYEVQRLKLKSHDDTWLSVQRVWSKRSARKIWWNWVNQEWTTLYVFRIYDRKTGKVVQ